VSEWPRRLSTQVADSRAGRAGADLLAGDADPAGTARYLHDPGDLSVGHPPFAVRYWMVSGPAAPCPATSTAYTRAREIPPKGAAG